MWVEPAAGTAGGYAAHRLPISVPSQRPNPDKAHPKVGVGLLSWSRGGKYLATRNDNMPRVLWIWDGETLLLHSLLIQQSAITDAAWHPTQPLLALCTGGSTVYMWSPKGCRVAPLPAAHELAVTSLSWNPLGDSLLLLDEGGRFCVCFLALPADPSVKEAAAAARAKKALGDAAAGQTEEEKAEEDGVMMMSAGELAEAIDDEHLQSISLSEAGANAGELAEALAAMANLATVAEGVESPARPAGGGVPLGEIQVS